MFRQGTFELMLAPTNEANWVAYHKAVNTALSDTLIPNAQNAELKALLQSGLGVFQAHQKHAEQLADQLQSASTSQ
jgi:putative membrane protein